MTLVAVGADHAGFALKEKLKPFLKQLGYRVVDLGNAVYDPADDYPDFAAKVGRYVAATNTKGLLFCGSAEGICIAANKIKGVRAVAPASATAAKMSRLHNDANVLCIAGGKTVDPKAKGLRLSLAKAKQIIKIWLSTSFSGETRHARRIKKITALEK